MNLDLWENIVQDLQPHIVSVLFICFISLCIALLFISFRQRYKKLFRYIRQLKRDSQQLEIENQNFQNTIADLKDEISQYRQKIEESYAEVITLSENSARYSEQLRLIKERVHTQQAQQEEEKHSQQILLENQFSVLAQKILDEKLKQTESYQKTSLESSLKPFREQLGSFQKKVEEIYDKDMRDRVSLTQEISQLKKLNVQISDDAVRLTQALRGQNKIQGNWGEMILEKVLEDSGLRKGHEYETQESHTSKEGKRLIPDVVVHLPNDKDIVIDAKVSLVSYERYISAQDDTERALACKEFLKSLRKHLNDLNSKSYEKLDSIRTLDFVFLFIPIEAAFLLALEHDTELFRTAFNKQVVLVSPTTLFACLRTVEHLWRYERQNKHAEEIANQAAGLHDKLVLFSESMLKIGNSLNQAKQHHQQALKQFSDGQGNVVQRARKLQKMGAPAKKRFSKQLKGTELSNLSNPAPAE